MHTHKIFPKINALCMPYLDETERIVMIDRDCDRNFFGFGRSVRYRDDQYRTVQSVFYTRRHT
jgi:hypothetical protein